MPVRGCLCLTEFRQFRYSRLDFAHRVATEAFEHSIRGFDDRGSGVFQDPAFASAVGSICYLALNAEKSS